MQEDTIALGIIAPSGVYRAGQTQAFTVGEYAGTTLAQG